MQDMIKIQDGVIELRKEIVYQQNYKLQCLVVYCTLSQIEMVDVKLTKL